MFEILKSFKSLSVLAFFQNFGKRLKNELVPAKEDVHMLQFCAAQSDSYSGHLFQFLGGRERLPFEINNLSL